MSLYGYAMLLASLMLGITLIAVYRCTSIENSATSIQYKRRRRFERVAWITGGIGAASVVLAAFRAALAGDGSTSAPITAAVIYLVSLSTIAVIGHMRGKRLRAQAAYPNDLTNE